MKRQAVRAAELWKRAAIAGAACAVILSAVRDARADYDDAPATTAAVPPDTVPAEPSSAPSRYAFEVGARFGYTAAPIRGAINPFGTGLGLRGGYAHAGVYFGATATYYVGGYDLGVSDSSVLVGAEVGYGFRVSEYVTLRPLIGIGDAVVSHTEPPVAGAVDVVTSASGTSASRRASGTKTSVNSLYLAPGVALLLASGPHFASLNAGALVVPRIAYGLAPAQPATWLSYTFGGQIGFRF